MSANHLPNNRASLTSSCSGPDRLFFAIREFELLVWHIRDADRVQDGDLAWQPLVEGSVHVPSVRAGVSFVKLFLTQRLFMEECVVLLGMRNAGTILTTRTLTRWMTSSSLIPW